MITNYTKVKEDVLQVYSCFESLISTIKNEETTTYDKSLTTLSKQAENIKQDKFLLMVVGEAKSGKSTFINAYLGEEILPMDVKQCTSSIVEIQYGERFTLSATFADDRVVTLENRKEIKDFLNANAALDDNYRDIPVSAINFEILMKKKGKRILETEIADLLKEIEKENIYGLQKDEYEKKVRKYIEEKQPFWKDIVTKIEIQYPFRNEDFRGIKIVDTPGVNADGRVGDITNHYIEEANAVIFLKPLTGQALEATSFRKFLQSASADRNKNAMFWILTRRADLTEQDAARLQEEAVRQCPVINSKQIILIDSKAQLYFNKAQRLTQEELKAYIVGANNEKKLDAFAMLAWYEASQDRDEFLERLKYLSNFGVMEEALNLFARKAHYLELSQFLKRMIFVIDNVLTELKEDILFYEKKAEDPIELGNEINHIKRELEVMTFKINSVVDEIVKKYTKTEGTINTKVTEVFSEYIKEIEAIDPNNSLSVEELEKISFRKIKIFTEFETSLKEDVIKECDEALTKLNSGKSIEYCTIKPDLTEEDFQKIKDNIKNSDDVLESYEYTTGKTFKETHKVSRFSQSKYYSLVKAKVVEKMDEIKSQAVDDLRQFVIKITNAYSDELTRNAKIKSDELTKIVQRKQDADDIKNTIIKLKFLQDELVPIKEKIESLKGGIDKNV